MPEGRFNEYSPQEQATKAREWLATRGLRMSADNLNRAMMALQGMPDVGDANAGPNMDSAVTRTMTDAPNRPASARPRAQAAAPRVGAGASFAEQSVGGDMPPTEPTEMITGGAAIPPTEAAQPAGADVAAMFPGGGGGDAGSNMDPITAVLTMLTPLALAGGPPAAAGRAAASVGGRNLGVTLNRPMIERVTPTSRMPGPPANMTPYAPPVAGPGNMPMLPPPASGGGAVAGAQGMPALPGGGGAAARLPAPQAATNPRGNPMLRTGPRRGQQGTAAPQNTTRNPGPRAGEDRPRGNTLREQLMQRRSRQDAARAARTGRD